jgi:hypothetical protein
MTSPTLRSVPRSSSGTMFSRIQGPPTSRAMISVFRAGKGEYQDQVPLADHRDVGSNPAGIDDALDDVMQLLGRRRRERVSQVQVVDDDNHSARTLSAPTMRSQRPDVHEL